MSLDKFQQFQHLLDQLEINDPVNRAKYRDLGVEKVIVSNDKKTWRFVLSAKEILPINAFIFLKKQLDNGFQSIVEKTEITIQNQSGLAFHLSDEALINSYFSIIQSKESSLSIKDIENKEKQNKIKNLFLEIGLNISQFIDEKNKLTLVDEIEETPTIVVDYDPKAIRANSLTTNTNPNSFQKSSSRPSNRKEIQNTIDAKSNKTQIIDVDEGRNIVIEGYIFATEVRTIKNNRKLANVKITDYSSSLATKRFINDDEVEMIENAKGKWARMSGNVAVDDFTHELTMTFNAIEFIGHEIRQDKSSENDKRVELHVHTQMTTTSGVDMMSTFVKRAKQWGHPAIAITDTASVQGYPDASAAAKANGQKVIYGLEANVVDDGEEIALFASDIELKDATYVAFDIETTGLSAIFDKIIELSAVKMKNNEVVEKFSEFINPGFPLSSTTIELTSITDEMVRDSKDEETVLNLFKQFIEGSILVGHNVSFDLGFLNTAYSRLGQDELSSPVINTLPFARLISPNLKRYTLGSLAKKFGIELEQAHRAIYDAQTTGRLSFALIKLLGEQYHITNHKNINAALENNEGWKFGRPSHATILVKNATGLKNLYQLVSKANTQYFERGPRTPWKELLKNKEGLLIGSGDSEGEVFTALVQRGYDVALELAGKYDYLEVQPLDNYQPQIESEFLSGIPQLKQIIKDLIRLGEELKKPVVVTGNVHYLDPDDAIYRQILVGAQAGNRENRYTLAPLYFKTTDELLEQFSFLDEKTAYQIIVENTQKINQEIESIEPLKSGSYRPKIDGANDEIKTRTFNRAHELYGNPLPEPVQQRLDKELTAIINNRFSSIYLIAQRLVEKSNKDGFLVGSRGSVGSSLVATMLGITEVNPLSPHYRSIHGDYTEFVNGRFESGYDLPPKENPNNPGEQLIGDGQNIPFETFLGFKGDKTPDIDLNFSGDYQPIAHNYTKVLFGEKNVFRAGTIATVAEKTAYGYVKGYERENEVTYSRAEEERLAIGVTGAKRTTGQHPGGILIVPKVAEVIDGDVENVSEVQTDIYDFTPVQFPADDQQASWQTTHLDYHSIHDNLLKMDILGHDDPTMLRTLQDMTGINPKSIPVNDPGVMSLFTSTQALNVDPKEIASKNGALGLPEFGTNFVRGMLDETHPTTYSELLQISGLSHGTDVYRGNADELIRSGQANIGSVIGTRDKIMTDLIGYGLDTNSAFQIMEKVRKGKGVSEEYQDMMREHGVPEWYIASAQKIKYMFPRAHAAAYVLMALRIAYFKVYLPTIYYAAYFSVRGDDPFELIKITSGVKMLRQEISRIRGLGNDATVNEKKSLTLYELANEAQARGIAFKMVDLYRSQATEWVIEGDELIAPFTSLPSLGESVAKQVIAARGESNFISKEDLAKRGNINKTLLMFMDNNGILEGLPDENQLALF